MTSARSPVSVPPCRHLPRQTSGSYGRVPPETLTVQQVAARYAVAAHTVLAWIRAGELRAVNVARNRRARRPSWRITAAAVEAFEVARAPQQPVVKSRRRKTRADVIEFY